MSSAESNWNLYWNSGSGEKGTFILPPQFTVFTFAALGTPAE